ncbi:MAG: hypothetical protein ACLVCH_13550 [Roseburia inulinivorans]
MQFINTWNEFYFALMLTSGDTARTVPIALNYYLGTFANNYSRTVCRSDYHSSSDHYCIHCITETGYGESDSRRCEGMI